MADVFDPIGPARTLVGATEWEADIGADETDRRIGQGDDFEDNSALAVLYSDSNAKKHMLTYASGARHNGRTIGNGYRIVRATGAPVSLNNSGSLYTMVFKGIQVRSEAANQSPFTNQNSGANDHKAVVIGCMLSQAGTGGRMTFAWRQGYQVFFTIMVNEGVSHAVFNGKNDDYINCLVVGKNGVAVLAGFVNSDPAYNNCVCLWPDAATNIEAVSGGAGNWNLGTNDGTLKAIGADSKDLSDGAFDQEDFILDYTAGAEDFKRAAAQLETWLVPDLRSQMEAEVPVTTDIEDVTGVQSADFTLYDTDKLLMGAEQVDSGGGGGGEVLNDLEAGTLEVWALVSSMNGGAA